eukprot:3644746-Rhodomonas_salina.3
MFRGLGELADRMELAAAAHALALWRRRAPSSLGLAPTSTSLCTCYAMSGTDCPLCTPWPVLICPRLPMHTVSGTHRVHGTRFLDPYVPASPCPVLTQRVVAPGELWSYGRSGAREP